MTKINDLFAKSVRNFCPTDISLAEKKVEDVEDEELLKTTIALSLTN